MIYEESVSVQLGWFQSGKISDVPSLNSGPVKVRKGVNFIFTAALEV